MNGILKNYTFSASAKTITLTDVATVNVKSVRFIKNLTTNTMIYSLADVLTISTSGNVITFTGPNVGMLDTDLLSIQYDLDISLDVQKVSLPTLPSATGNITTQNLVPLGAATAGSAVECATNGCNSMSIQVANAYTGALSVQVTIDGVNWATLTGSALKALSDSQTATISSGATGIFVVNCSRAVKVRVTALAAVTGTANIVLQASNGVASVTVDAIPTVSVQGTSSHSATPVGNPIYIAGKVVPLTVLGIELLQAAGDLGAIPVTPEQQLIVKNFSPAALDFNAIGNLTNTITANTFKAASSASTRNYISQINISSSILGGATELAIRDAPITFTSQTLSANTLTSSQVHDLKPGDEFVASVASNITGLTPGTLYYVLTTPSTTTLTLSASPFGSTLTITGSGVTMTANRILYRIGLAAGVNNIPIPLTTPLRGSVNGIFDILTTTAVTGTVYYNIQGFTAAQ